MLSDPIIVVARLARVLDDLGIPYLVGGSLASSVYGIPRTTQDVHLVAGIGLPHVDALARALVGEFYVEIRFSSPEDTVLHKLRWYRMGNEVSERQWNDILGILKVQKDTLDQGYLDRWAGALGVVDL
jgi:hypothetical protein